MAENMCSYTRNLIQTIIEYIIIKAILNSFIIRATQKETKGYSYEKYEFFIAMPFYVVVSKQVIQKQRDKYGTCGLPVDSGGETNEIHKLKEEQKSREHEKYKLLVEQKSKEHETTRLIKIQKNKEYEEISLVEQQKFKKIKRKKFGRHTE